MTKKHPYVGLPARQFWKQEPGIKNPDQFDPISTTPFTITKDEPVVTAGSCFAQHVARHIAANGFNHLITENAHPMFSENLAKNHNYAMFAARYGNVYTARQFKQLLLRAWDQFHPQQDVWETSSGSFVDPFRPQIQPGGYFSPEELKVDQQVHFAAIQRAFTEMSTFVFTLGLTECWVDTRDGAVFPIAPGVAGGIFDPETVTFKNFSLEETVEDLLFALNFIRTINPTVKIILTVSPVALNATYEDRHVWTSTVWSKSVLRLAAETATEQLEQCVYFPSYEIITSPYARGSYFAPDCRDVTPAGVTAVMGVFNKHFCEMDTPEAPENQSNNDERQNEVEEHMSKMESSIQALCDEEAISDS